MQDRAAETKNIRISTTGTPGEFLVKGILTIEHVAEERNELRDIFSRHDSVVLQIDAHATIDLFFLQLLCSACRTALKQGKSFSVRKDVPDSYSSLLNEAGFSRKRGCSLDANNNCIWIPGEGQ